MTTPLRLGIIGCGAIAETGHLPACEQVDQARVTALVDIDLVQAQRLAAQYNIPQADADYRAILDSVDAVIVATPPHLHVEHAGFFLERGIHVLCEKPLADSATACERLLEIASSSPDVKLAVGHVRRFFFYAEKMKEMIGQERLGQVTEVWVDEGYPYGWPARTDYAFRRDIAPGGVLFDLGVHVLDLCVWLLGPISNLRYGDDAIGGVESNVGIALEFESGAQGRIRLSRTCERSNRMKVVGVEGELEASVYVPGQLIARIRRGKRCRISTFRSEQSLVSVLARQLADFVGAVNGGHSPEVTGRDGLTAVRLVEQCYRQVRGLDLPKMAPIPGVIRWA
jgi:predicted dehydrogenase